MGEGKRTISLLETSSQKSFSLIKEGPRGRVKEGIWEVGTVGPG